MESVSALKLSEAESDGARHRVAWRDGGVVVSWRRSVVARWRRGVLVASWLGGVVVVERRTEVPVLSQQVSRSSSTVHGSLSQSMFAWSALSA